MAAVRFVQLAPDVNNHLSYGVDGCFAQMFARVFVALQVSKEIRALRLYAQSAEVQGEFLPTAWSNAPSYWRV